MSNWTFCFGGSPSALANTPGYIPPTSMSFPSVTDLLVHLANDGSDQPEIQSQIGRRLKNDRVAKAWHQQRQLLKSLVHYPKYKRRHYDLYHAAARAVAASSATSDQNSIAAGLSQEISASSLIIPAKQLVFHGRCNIDLHCSPNYTTFISTTLDPVVAINNAMRRAGYRQSNGRPVVYALTLRDPLHAIWGNGGKPYEWELLFDSSLSVKLTRTHYGKRFDIVEATIGR